MFEQISSSNKHSRANYPMVSVDRLGLRFNSVSSEAFTAEDKSASIFLDKQNDLLKVSVYPDDRGDLNIIKDQSGAKCVRINFSGILKFIDKGKYTVLDNLIKEDSHDLRINVLVKH